MNQRLVFILVVISAVLVLALILEATRILATNVLGTSLALSGNTSVIVTFSSMVTYQSV